MVRFTIQVICAAFQRGYVRSSEPTATRSHRSRVPGYLRATLFPLFQGPFIDPKLAGENSS